MARSAFHRLWLGLSLSYLGDQFTIIALVWFVLQLTRSGAAVGLVILCLDLPGVVTGSILGRLLDRYQPRMVMGLDNLARATIIAVMPILFALGWLRLWHILFLAAMAGSLSPATTAGVRVLLPRLVDDGALDNANIRTSASLQFSYLAGPAAAGFVIARFGGTVALFIDAGSFLLMGILLLTLPAIVLPKRAEPKEKNDLLLGYRSLSTLPFMRAITILSFIFFFSYGPLETALPIYSGNTLQAGVEGFGLLWTGFGVGAFSGALLLTRLCRRWPPSLAFPMIAVFWGALLCPILLVRQLPLAVLLLTLAGASWAPYMPMETSLLQRLVPPEVRGQVFGARHSILAAAAPLGAACGGLMLQIVSAQVVIAISGVACIVAGLGGMLSPSLRQLPNSTGREVLI